MSPFTSQRINVKIILLASLIAASTTFASAQPARFKVDAHGRRRGVVETHWPNGHVRSRVQYADDVFHGEYRTWTIEGKPYELKHFAFGREVGRQQAWDSAGKLYLNYEVRDGRRYGMANAKPCLPAGGM